MGGPPATAGTVDGVEPVTKPPKGNPMSRIALLALLCFAVAACTSVASAATPIAPSRAQAIYDVKVELVNHFIALMDTSRTSGPDTVAKAQVGCDPLTNTLWRCTWIGKSPLFYDVTGNAKVRFYTYGSDVSLYNVKCYNTTQVDNCGYALRHNH